MHSTKSQSNESHGDNIFVLIEQYFPNDGKLEKVVEIAKESAKGIYGVQGLLQAKVLRPKTKSGPVCNVTTWKSEEDFKLFMKSDAVKELYKSDMMKNVKDWTSEINVQMFGMEDGWHQ